MNTVRFTVDDITSPRIDVWLARTMDVSRTRIQRWIDKECITVNGLVVTSSHHAMREGDDVVVCPPAPQAFHLTPQPMSLDIMFEDEYILVINKPSGLVVHPGPGHRDATLIHGLLAHCGGSLCSVGDKERPGIVHRLDQHTSGLMVIAKTDAAHAGLSEQFQTRSLKRTYRALVWGRPRQLNFEIDAPIGRHPKLRQKQAVVNHGKDSLTFVHVLSTWTLFEPDGWVSEWQCQLETGRTHQIRVHATHIGYPIIGDPLYGKTSVSSRYPEELRVFPRQALHAEHLELIHPISGEELEWEADVPQDYKDLRQAIVDRSEGK